jgi:hypothetical protein
MKETLKVLEVKEDSNTVKYKVIETDEVETMDIELFKELERPLTKDTYSYLQKQLKNNQY